MDGCKAILFVDDEEYLAEVGKEMLEDYDYRVDIEIDPFKALTTFENAPDRYELLISDYTMPGMKGDELIDRVRRIRPGLPAILCSGIQLDDEGVALKTISKILMKPFDMDVLLAAVREVLGDEGV